MPSSSTNHPTTRRETRSTHTSASKSAGTGSKRKDAESDGDGDQSNSEQADENTRTKDKNKSNAPPKKRQKRHVDSSAEPLQPAGTNNEEDSEIVVNLKAQIVAMKKKEKALSTALANHSSNKENATKQTEKIKSIPKPHGEAGDSSKGGFKLIEAMRLEGKKDLYNQIMTCTKDHCKIAGIDPKLDLNQQDTEKLAKVYKATRQKYPYVSAKRFPGNWPIKEIIKQWSRNHKRYARKKGRMPKRGDGGNDDDNEDEDDEEENVNEDKDAEDINEDEDEQNINEDDNEENGDGAEGSGSRGD